MRRSLIAFCAGLLGATLLVSCGPARAKPLVGNADAYSGKYVIGVHLASIHSTSAVNSGCDGGGLCSHNNAHPGHLRISAMPCVGRSLVPHASMEF